MSGRQWYPRNKSSFPRTTIAINIKREPTRILMVIWVKNLQTELMVEIYFKSLVRAIGKVFLMNLI